MPSASPGIYVRPESPRSISTLMVSLSSLLATLHSPWLAAMVPK